MGPDKRLRAVLRMLPQEIHRLFAQVGKLPHMRCQQHRFFTHRRKQIMYSGLIDRIPVQQARHFAVQDLPDDRTCRFSSSHAVAGNDQIIIRPCHIPQTALGKLTVGIRWNRAIHRFDGL